MAKKKIKKIKKEKADYGVYAHCFFTDDEYHAFLELCNQQELPESACLKQALRLYQMHVLKSKEGMTCKWFNADGTPEFILPKKNPYK